MNNLTIIRDFVRDNPIIIRELGRNLHKKITSFSVRKKSDSIKEMTLNDCIDYVNAQTFNIYIREKSIIEDGLVNIFPDVKFEVNPPDYIHSCDIDYLGFVGKLAFGIQIKPITAKSNFGNYSPSERMKASFEAFTEDFGGKVFLVFSLDGEIGNKEVIEQISKEIERLKQF